jgi:hypothetical protein
MILSPKFDNINTNKLLLQYYEYFIQGVQKRMGIYKYEMFPYFISSLNT